MQRVQLVVAHTRPLQMQVSLPCDTRRTKTFAAAALLVLLVAPSAAAPEAADITITVTTISDLVNGDVMTVAGLIANTGPDGISLREAIEATENDPGSYTIRFAPALAGKTIALAPSDVAAPLMLTGGGVTIEGDVDGNGKPDVTIRPQSSLRNPSGFIVSSSRNRLHALTLEGFATGVSFTSSWRTCCPGAGEFPSHRTFADNVVSGVVMRDISHTGIEWPGSVGSACGVPTDARPCPTYNAWTNTTLTGNTVEAAVKGILIDLHNATDDRLEGVTITDNTIRIDEPESGGGVGDVIAVASGGNSTGTRISGVLIARNSIEGVGRQAGIVVFPGGQRAEANTIDGVRILDNRIDVGSSRDPGRGIVLTAGSDVAELIYPDVHPVRYPDDNVLRNVDVRGNSITGTLDFGVSVEAGTGAGGSSNRIENVRIVDNAVRSDLVASGVHIWLGDGEPFQNRYATGNRIVGVSVHANRIVTGNVRGRDYAPFPAGVVILGGGRFGRGNAVRDVRITKNTIATTYVPTAKARAYAAIQLIGGWTATARGNSVSCVHLAGNRITGTRRTVSVRSNIEGASGNRATLGGC